MRTEDSKGVGEGRERGGALYGEHTDGLRAVDFAEGARDVLDEMEGLWVEQREDLFTMKDPRVEDEGDLLVEDGLERDEAAVACGLERREGGTD